MWFFLLFLIPPFLNLSLGAETWKDHYLVKNCYIYKMNGDKVKTYPGMICQFFDDGRC